MVKVSEIVAKHMELCQHLMEADEKNMIDYSDLTTQRHIAKLLIASTPQRQIDVLEKFLKYIVEKRQTEAEKAEDSPNNT